MYTLVCGYCNYQGHCETSGFYDEGYNTSQFNTLKFTKMKMLEAIETGNYYEVFILDQFNNTVIYRSLVK